MDEVRRGCALLAQYLAGLAQVAEVAAGGCSCSGEQFVAAGEMSSGEASCAGGGSCSGEQFVAAGDMSSGEASCAPVAAPPPEVQPGAQAAGDADAPPQSHPAPPLPKATPRLAGGANLLAADFAGATGRRGKAELQRAVALQATLDQEESAGA